jgi:hypothetical protein
MIKQFVAQVVITVEADGPFVMDEIRKAAEDAISIDLATENSENTLEISNGEINGVSIDWNTLIDSAVHG